ncbi:MAG: guanylate kinase [Candidatus Omnitrophica bacterium]|nr:guanylate kinase [Candidatus Omnitrophota bacterium]
MVVLSAPSGCGKTTLVTRLLKRHSRWIRSISVTTRPPRLGEKKGRDYEFVSRPRFQALKEKKQFLEWARVFGHSYGTRKRGVEEGIAGGETVLLAVDVQGHRKIRRFVGRKFPLLSLFILPPSISALRERLENRKTDSPEEIQKRIQVAQEEIKAAREYDATVINRDLDQTVHEIETLIEKFEETLKGGK